MTLKGKTFTAEDFPKRQRAAMQRRRMTEAKINDFIEAWAAEQNRRYKVVAMDGETPIIGEELMQRVINKLSPKARRIAGAMMNVDQDVRAEVMRAFYENGDLKIPFKLVE